MGTGNAALTPQALAGRILVVRGQRVMLDADLAQLYDVETRALNQAVKRNLGRFPTDFMFQLTAEEFADLRSQNEISSQGGRRYAPFAFTEHGSIMAAAILNSDRAVQMSVYVVRAFVQLRDLLSTHKALAQKLDQLERRVTHHDNSLVEIIDTIRALMPGPSTSKRSIGFTADMSSNGPRTRSMREKKA